ncbi:MAG: T9SS type A sorting domain-containing protein [Bacteroidetes bacterium]|nr:T9SS type A sorting domain-containing protein [Bacteroidota bacterium]
MIFEKNNQALDYRIYPNPSTGLITFEFPATTQNENLVINITNMTGRVVQQYKCTSEDRLIQMNLSNLPRSTYFVQIRCSTYDIIEKIILH